MDQWQPTNTPVVQQIIIDSVNVSNQDLDLKILPSSRRMSPPSLSRQLAGDSAPLLVDVRSAPEFSMCRLEGTVNWPSDSLRGERLDQLLSEVRRCARQVVFICRRGNDSQLAAQAVIDAIEEPYKSKISDLKGGLHAWSKEVDNNFPIY